jgi:hypothetical protein|tara:strand:+ start:498 stop:611 length:114 start_codon:yes stop_codon:yes gene_type:complete
MTGDVDIKTQIFGIGTWSVFGSKMGFAGVDRAVACLA